MRYLPTPEQTARLTPEELRTHFLVSGLFAPGEARYEMVDLDRVTLGGVVPLGTPITLVAPEEFAAKSFTERRELGILNIGGAGAITVDGIARETKKLDMVYVGRGAHDVSLSSADVASPARFFVVSYPAHVEHPTAYIAASDADASELGTQEKANRRRLARYIHQDGVKSAQLVMGVTALHEGSVWNTMPPHTHVRRTEVYLYFDLPADAVVFHMMGAPDSTQHLVVRDGDVALSPSWSIHSGCGTTNYTFCWAMGGENQEFADMQGFELTTLR
ncbi:MAG TPA: 5-dehydro-4-deoxy-D-glucuronate isomerase [Gemmatimonadaceae bacterium]|nr:5-dehydro-4-deoxy-D-glucuronate isomerase [Gemmatimonadaceae bacterium]